MGESGCDVKLSHVGKVTFPFAVECKNQENLNIWAALKQAEAHADRSLTTPLVVFTRNNSKIYVALPFDDFMKLQASNEVRKNTQFDYDEMMQRSHKELDKITQKITQKELDKIK